MSTTLYWRPVPTGGAVDGLPVRLVRFANRNAIRAYGNSVVPQVVEVIGRAIVKAEKMLHKDIQDVQDEQETNHDPLRGR